MPGVFPDYKAPVVRNAPDGIRELAMPRWGIPSSSQALMEAAGKRADKLRAKSKEVETTNDLFGVLTTEPNAEIAAIHPKAMPVILTEPTESDMWLNAPFSEVIILQRPLPDCALKTVAHGLKQDTM